MQQWFGIGRLTADPELRYTNSGTAVASFTLAVDRNRKDAQGNKQTDFVNIVAWQKLGELCGQYLAKGRQTGITGELQSRTYENRDGQKVKVWEIVANQVQFLDKGGDNGGSGSTTSAKPTPRYDDDPFADDDTTVIDISDDDLPF